MSNILFETANAVCILKTDDKDALMRSTDAQSVMRYVTLQAQLPFGSSDEATQCNMMLQEGRLPDAVSEWVKQTVGSGNILVQDGRMLKQLQDLGFQPEFNQQTIEIFRKIRAHSNALLKADPSQAFNASLALCHATSRAVCQFDKNRSDAQLMQAVGLFDTLSKDLNQSYMRLAECESLHFPELRRVVLDNELFVAICQAFPNRSMLKKQEDFAEKVATVV